jgi:hypothetical protein
METGSIASAVAGGQTGTAVGTAMLRKVLDLQEQNAAQLLAALPQPVRYSNPPNLGQSVDTFA